VLLVPVQLREGTFQMYRLHLSGLTGELDAETTLPEVKRAFRAFVNAHSVLGGFSKPRRRALLDLARPWYDKFPQPTARAMLRSLLLWLQVHTCAWGGLEGLDLRQNHKYPSQTGA